MKVQWHAVGFFDLLGQREKMNGLILEPGRQVAADYSERYVELIQPVGLQRQYFKKALRDSHARWKDYEPPDALAASARRKLKRLFTHEIKMRAFSDSVVLWSPLSRGTGEPDLMGLTEIITAAAAVSLTLWGAKTAVRGGITVNAGGKLPKGDFYGPVIGAAVAAEKEADWPRIILDRHATRFIDDALRAPGREPLRIANWHLARFAKEMLCQFKDDRFMVDAFGPRFMGKSEVARREFQDVVEFVNAERERFTAANDEKLKKRYEILSEYIASRLAALDPGQSPPAPTST